MMKNKKYNEYIKLAESIGKKIHQDAKALGEKVHKEVIIPICKEYNVSFHNSGNGSGKESSYWFCDLNDKGVVYNSAYDYFNGSGRDLRPFIYLLHTEVLPGSYLGYYVKSYTPKGVKHVK